MYSQKIFSTLGFTLTELIVVIGILGILAVGLLTTINPVDKLKIANDARVKSDIAEISRALQAYAITHNGHYPKNLATLVSSGDLKSIPTPPLGYSAYQYTSYPANCSDSGPIYCTSATIYGQQQSLQYQTTPYYVYDSVTGNLCNTTNTSSTVCVVATNTIGPTNAPTPTLPPGITPTTTLIPPTDSIITDILDNIKQNGFDSNPINNNGLGGLWVNWKYGSNPLQTNFDGSGTPTPGGLGYSNDPLTNIRYLHNLLTYKYLNKSDTRYDSEIIRYTPIVKSEFNNASDQRGWLYDEEFMDMYKTTGDNFYLNQAQNLASTYARSVKPVGIIYKTNSTHPLGYYRVDEALEEGLALVQAGAQFNNPDWTTKGQNMVNFVYSHAYIPQYHTFPDQMDQVLNSDGSANPNEIFYIDRYCHDPSHCYTIGGNEMRMGSISQIIISLLDAYNITNNSDYLNKAKDLLNPLTATNNNLGMWDTSPNMGYYASVTFNGTSSQNPGSLSVATSKKEAGRQITMLWAFHLANKLTGGIYQDMEQNMVTVATTKAYYQPGHGLLYETDPNWNPLLYSNKQIDDAVTTEAMGAELEGLLSLQR